MESQSSAGGSQDTAPLVIPSSLKSSTDNSANSMGFQLATNQQQSDQQQTSLKAGQPKVSSQINAGKPSIQSNISSSFLHKPKQRKLQILKYQTENKLFSVMSKDRYEVTKNANQEADFVIEDSCYSFIFLSLKYHLQNNSKYIVNKLDAFKKNPDYLKYKKRILLLLCDADDEHDAMLNIHRITEEFGITILCGFSFLEIAAYINTFIQCSNNQQFAKQYLQNRK